MSEKPARDLRTGVVGQIRAGREAGRFVELVDDSENTGGWLIFTYGRHDRSGEAFDTWAASIVDVDLYFDDCGWVVEWPD